MDSNTLRRLFKAKSNQIRMLKARGYDVGDEASLIRDFEGFRRYYESRLETMRVESANEITRDPKVAPRSLSFRSALGRTYAPPAEIQSYRPFYVIVDFPEAEESSNSKYWDSITELKKAKQKTILGARFKFMIITEHALGSSDIEKWGNTLEDGFQHFTIHDLQYNPIDSIHAPKYRLLSPKERDELVERTVPRHQLNRQSEELHEATEKAATEDELQRLKNQHEKQNKGWKKDIQRQLAQESRNSAMSVYYDAAPGDIFEITRRNLIHASDVEIYRTYRVVG